MPTITSVKAIQVLDSRGLPTVSCSIKLSDGSYASAIVPSGASTGTKEALELRDGTNAYLGKGVQKAVTNINSIIAPAIINLDPEKQAEIDKIMTTGSDLPNGGDDDGLVLKNKETKKDNKITLEPLPDIEMTSPGGGA